MKKLKVRLLEMQDVTLPIRTEYIKLDSALKLSGVAETGGHAKELVEKGAVRVNGEVCVSRGKKLYPGDSFEFKALRYTIAKEPDEAE